MIADEYYQLLIKKQDKNQTRIDINYILKKKQAEAKEVVDKIEAKFNF